MVTAGDSGGPIFVTNSSEPILFGIVSTSGFTNMDSMSDEQIKEIEKMDNATYDQETNIATVIPLGPHISWIKTSIQELSK